MSVTNRNNFTMNRNHQRILDQSRSKTKRYGFSAEEKNNRTIRNQQPNQLLTYNTKQAQEAVHSFLRYTIHILNSYVCCLSSKLTMCINSTWTNQVAARSQSKL